jgi:phosphocarrier protein
MEKRTVVVSDPNGLHLRSAARIVKSCKKFDCRISLGRDDYPNADACSILQLLLLKATRGSEVTITAIGPDEKEACREIAGIFDYAQANGTA